VATFNQPAWFIERSAVAGIKQIKEEQAMQVVSPLEMLHAKWEIRRANSEKFLDESFKQLEEELKAIDEKYLA
jgi:hypothetical protein